MMNERIENDIKSSMKTGDKFTLSVLRMLKSAMQMAKKSQRDELADEEILAVLKKQVKVRKESMAEYEKYGRDDLVQNLAKEIEILSVYLPEELSEAEIDKILDEIFEEVNPESIKDMGKVMKLANEKLATNADMSLVSAKVKEKLS